VGQECVGSGGSGKFMWGCEQEVGLGFEGVSMKWGRCEFVSRKGKNL